MPAAEFLQTPLQFLKGVGPRRAADLARVDLVTVEDLLCRLPSRYEDRRHLTQIAALRAGQTTTIAGEVLSCGLRPTRRPGFRIFEVLLRDDSGAIRAVWLNQPFLKDVLHVHQRVVLYGSVETRHRGGLQLTNPQYEIVQRADSDGAADEALDDTTIHTGRIVPVYEKVGVLTPKMQRRLVHETLRGLPEEVSDRLPDEIRCRLALPSRGDAFLLAHFPEPGTSLDLLNGCRSPAQVRLVFEEFFLFQLGLQLRRRRADAERKPTMIRVDAEVRESARRVLPFKLTPGQREALKEIVALLHGRMRPDLKDEVMRGFARGDHDVLVSTSVVEVGVDVANASVMVIEHAERFGLAQLHQLRGRVGRGPHQSHCQLLYQSPLSDQARARLDVLTQTTDGFVIAERDLELRGPGDFFGTRQSGIPTLRVGDLLRDHRVMEDARREAVAWLARGRVATPLVEYVRSTWEERYGLVGVG